MKRGTCDGDPRNGCETTLTSATHCGGCNNPCTPAQLPNTSDVTCGTGTCAVAQCATGWAHCDANNTNGCERRLDTCASGCCSNTSLGSHQGDNGGCTLRSTQFGTTEQCFSFRVNENDNGCNRVAALLELAVPAGADFDLYVSAPISCQRWDGASWVSGCSGVQGSGATERVRLWRDDECFFGVPTGSNQGFDIGIEIRYYGGTTCSSWQLNAYSGRSCGG